MAGLAAVGFMAPAGSSVDRRVAVLPLNISKYSSTILHVKLKQRVAISADAREFTANTDQGIALNHILQLGGHVGHLSPLSRAGANARVENVVGRALRDYYVVRFDHAVDMAAVIADLGHSGLVEDAFPAALPAPPPTTPLFANMQNYRTAAPVGTNSIYAAAFPGGRGSRVKFVDIEYSWNLNHEDLANARTALVPNGTPVDPFTSPDHGTAVLGEIDATSNNFGVTGAANQVDLKVVNADNSENGYDLTGALTTAASITQPGDVIEIEQQAFGPDMNSDFVPVEWMSDVYDAIKALTASGRIVVEPAGNGSQNLDNVSLYGSSFPSGKADSGAIIVGAGENCTGSPHTHSRLSFSDYGARVNLQGAGDCVTTTGYGDLYSTGGANAYYTQSFNGTSSATPIVAAAAASLSSAYKTVNNNAVLSPAGLRTLLIQNSTPQDVSAGATTGHIGPYPDLEKALATTDTHAPSVAVLDPARVVQLSTSIPVGWSAVDPGGVNHIKTRFESAPWNGGPGAWTNWLSFASAMSATYAGTFAHTYCFEVRAEDIVGNISNWSAPRCTAVPLRSDQLSHSQHWSKVIRAAEFAGFGYVTTTHGATMARPGMVAQGISLVATKCSECGVIQVRWNGTLVKTVDLVNPTTVRAQVIPIVSFSSARAGTLSLVVTSATGTRVVIEGLASYNP